MLKRVREIALKRQVWRAISGWPIGEKESHGLGYRPERSKAQGVVRTEICSEKSLPICRGVIDPVAFFETESLSWPAAVARRTCRRRDLGLPLEPNGLPHGAENI
jgi:hypothetical protein